MKTILLASSLVLLSPALAVDIAVGTTSLSIPAPEGFSPITGDMMPFTELAKRFVPPSNDQFALFLPAADVVLAAKGEIPNPERRFYVQTAKKLIQPFVSNADFLELKRIIKTQNDEILKKAEAQMPGLLREMNKGISDDYNVALNLSVTQMLPFPPHYETERGLSYSTILKYSINGADGKPTVFEGVVTATFLHLQGKVLFLYANAEKSGLAWSRLESRKWADKVVAANPSTGAVAAQETHQRHSGIDWSKVAGKAIGGVILGGIIGLLGYLFRKKNG